jgi:hypothetical protein
MGEKDINIIKDLLRIKAPKVGDYYFIPGNIIINPGGMVRVKCIRPNPFSKNLDKLITFERFENIEFSLNFNLYDESGSYPSNHPEWSRSLNSILSDEKFQLELERMFLRENNQYQLANEKLNTLFDRRIEEYKLEKYLVSKNKWLFFDKEER